MKHLTIETGLGRATIALQLADGRIATRTSTDAHANATELLPMIEAMLAENTIAFQDLTEISCGIGPGSFTGIRIGLAAARGLGLALNIAVHGVSTLAACADKAFRTYPELRNGAVMVVIDAMREQLYTQVFRYENSSQPLSEPLLCDNENLTAALVHASTVAALVGNGAAIAAEWLNSTLPQHPELPTAEDMATLAAAQRAANIHTPPAPLYVRAPDAKLPTKPAVWG